MNFADTVLAVESSSKQFNTFYINCENFIETAINELHEDVITEADKSSDGALVKISKAIEALFKKLKEAIAKMVSHIKSFFTDEKTKTALNKADKAVKDNPKLKDIKVEIPDIDAISRIYNENINALNKEFAAIRSGKKVSDKEKFNEMVKKTDEDAKKTAMKVVAIGSLIALISGAVIKFESDSKKDIVDAQEMLDYDLEGPVEQMEALTAVSRAAFKSIHNKEAQISSSILNAFNTLAGAFTGLKESGSKDVGKKAKKVKVEESVTLNENNQEEYLMKLMESVDDDLAESKTDNSFSAEDVLTEIEESVYEKLENTETHTITVGEYLESLENELFCNDDSVVSESNHNNSYMNYLNDCLSELKLAQESMNEYEEIDAYLEIFEADKQNQKLLDQIKKNEKAKAGTESHLKKAIHAIIDAINKLIAKIKNVFSSKKMDEKEKGLNSKLAAAKKYGISINGKKVKILDTGKFNSQYDALLKEAEDFDKQLAAGKDVIINPIINKIKNFCTGGVNAISVSVGMEAALQAASSSKEMAREMSAYLEKDRALQERLMDAVGEKEYKSFKKDVDAFGKRVSLRQAILRLKGYKAQSLEDSIKRTFDQCDKIFSSVGDLASVALNNPIKNDGSMSKLEYNAKTAAYFAKHRKEVAPAAKDLISNRGVKVANRILGNEEIKDVAQLASSTMKNKDSYNRKLFKATQKAYDDAVKKNARLINSKNKNKSDQSMMNSILGTYDKNSTLKGSALDKAITGVNNLL